MPAQVAGTALTNRVNGISGRVEGSVQQNQANGITLNGGAVITGDLLVLGMPTVVRNGNPTYGGTIEGMGTPMPNGYSVMLNGGSSLQHVVRRTNALALTPVAAPASPTGRRSVTVNTARQSVGAWSTLRNLTLNGGAGQFTVPAGAYGDFVAGSGSGFVLGVAGAKQPAVYSFQRLTLNGQASLKVVGPVRICVGSAVFSNGPIGSLDHPEWLEFRVQSGNLVLNSAAWLAGYVYAPTSEVIVNSNTQLVGGLECDALRVNGGGVLRLWQRNRAPVVAPQRVVTNEDTAVAFVLAGSDPDGQSLAFTVLTRPTIGSLSGIAPNLTYTPPANFFGSTTFTFKASDGALESAAATVTIEVRPVNDRPAAEALVCETDEDMPVAFALCGSDVDGDPLAYRIVDGPAHGAISGTAPDLNYRPDTNFNGVDELTYVVNDGTENSVPATVRFTVRPINDCPVSVAVPVHTLEDQSAPVVLTAVDVDGDAPAFAIIEAPVHGTLAGSAPDFVYIPAADYNGPDSFTYTVSDGRCTTAVIVVPIAIDPVNDVPVASDLELVADEDVAVAAVLSGTDVDRAPLTYRIVSGPSNGTLSGTAPTLTYHSNADWSGTESFTYVVNDGTVDSAEATVRIVVRPVNDCPVSAAEPVSTREDIAVPVVLAAIDRDSATLTFAIIDAPAHGVLVPGSAASTSASFTYTPAANYNGADAFTYTVTDGLCTTAPITVPITVEPVNDAPNAHPQELETPEDTALPITLSGTDPEASVLSFKILTQPQHGTLKLDTSTSSYLYSPAANWFGSDSFTFTANDAELTSAAATVGIVVTPVNDRPEAFGDTIQVRNNTNAPVVLRGSDIDGDALAFTVVKQPTHGTLSGTAPQLVYTPERSYLGADLVEFRVSDGSLDSSVAVIVIDVVAGNTDPIANAQSLETDEDKALPIVLTGTDADRDPLSFTVVDQPRHGSLAGTAPDVVYTPTADYFGADSFTFKVADATDESVPVTVSITVKPVNDPPIVDAGADSAITLPAYGMLVGTATDPDGDALTLQWSQVTGPAKVDFETPGTLSTRISITTPGSYVFLLTANDGATSASDEVTVVVNSSSLVFRAYTTTADFETGTRTNVFSKVPDQLELNEVADAGNFLWVAVSSKGTIVKINTKTGKVEGEYWTSPSGQPKNPSRTTVDLHGAVWCTNRDGNSVVQVGSVESGMWIDKNGNGQPDTSTGLGNVRAWTNAGGTDTNGGVSTAEDECIINYTRVSSSGTRHICVDRKNNIWVSGTGNRVFDYIDSKNGKILRSEGSVGYGGYGGIIDRNGVIWSTSWSSLLRWDTSKPLTGPVGENWMSCAGSSQYGLALGPDGYVWASGYGAGTVFKYAPDGTLVGSYKQGNSAAQGLTVDRRGHVWVAHSTGSSTVGHLAPNGTWLGNVTVGSGPTGVAVDADGKIWATNYNSGTVSRIDPNAGPLGSDGVTPVGAVDFTSVYLGGNLYNYSDMTGSTLTAPPLTGVWTTMFDSGKVGTPWGSINWHADICDDAKLTLTVCSSVDGVTFSPWRVGVRGEDLDVPDGRYLKLNVRLQRASSGASPILYDVTIGEEGYSPDYPFNAAPRIEAAELQAANYGVEANLEATVWDDGLPHPSTLTYSWSKVSGPGEVAFDDADWVKPTATFSEHGNYVLRLTASDGVETVTRDITVVANTPPTANAGPDLGVREAGGTINLQGLVWDDGAALNGLVVSWRQLSGPVEAVFADLSSPTSTVTFSAVGRYRFELNVSDGWAESTDTVGVRVGQATSAEVPRDVAAWWPFDEDYRDVVHGILAKPASAPLEDGYAGRALTLNGTNASAATVDDPRLDIASEGSFTAELWVRSEENRYYPRLLSWGSPEGVRLYQTNGQITANFRDRAGSGTDHEFSVDSALAVGQWAHVAITYDKESGAARIYVNGVIKAAQSIGSFMPQTTGPLYFACPNRTYFKGQLDEITLYRRALRPDEIYAIYESGVVGKAPADGNVAPVVDAGPNRSVATTADAVELSGQIVDDGMPAGATLASGWAQVSGPGLATFADASSASTTATFDLPGIYVLRLTADDTLLRSSDTMEVRVASSSGVGNIDGQVLWWPCNNTYDEVYTGRDAQPVNGVGFSAGKVSDAYSFDGADDYAMVPGDAVTDIASEGSFTAELWVRSEENRYYPRLLSWGSPEGVRLYQTNGQLTANFRDRAGSGTDHEFSVDSALAVGQWAHVAITYDKESGAARIYVNGVIRAAQSIGSFMPQTTGPLYFARPNRTYFKGQLDEITLYRRALRPDEIYAIYESGVVGKAPADGNVAPVVDAGPNRSVATTADAVELSGQIVDDGMPAGATLASGWAQVSGPGLATFADASSASTTATFDLPGIYVLRLTADDTLLRSSDTMEVRVASSSGVGNIDGQVLWWPCNNTYDEVYTGRDAQPVNGVGFAEGKVSQAYTFDGLDDYVMVPGDSTTDIASEGSFTAELWVRSEENRYYPRLLSWGSPEGVRLYQTNGQLTANFRDRAGSGTDHEFSVDSALAVGQWAHVAITYDKESGAARIYVNGVIKAAQSIGSFIPQTTGPLYFARPNRTYFYGQLDEITLYRRALRPDEIYAIYESGVVGKAPADGNVAPVVDAGPNRSVATTADAVELSGQIVDDGKPAGATLASGWEQVSGPGLATFADANFATTTATFDLPGIYVLRLTADDTLLRSSDTMEVRVASSSGVGNIDGQALWWPCNSNFQEVLTGRDAQPVNGVGFSAGKVSDAYSFDGADDYAMVPGDAVTDIASEGSFTAELWVRSEENRYYPRLLSWGSPEGVRLYQTNGQITANVRDRAGSGTDHEFSVDSVLAVGQWAHVAITYDKESGAARIYVNGVIKAAQSIGSFIPQTTGPLYFARPNRTYFKGQLDEISLYRRALTADEIRAIFNAGTIGKDPVVVNRAPVVAAAAGNGGTVYPGTALALASAAIDDGLPNPPASLTYSWSKLAGPGSVTFADATTLNTTASFDFVGTYTVRFTASDSLLSAHADVTVTVVAPPSNPPTVEFVSPVDGGTIPADTRTMLIVRATDTDGSIGRIEFFRDGVSLGLGGAVVGQTDQYGMVVATGFPVGTYTFTAKVTDNTNLSATTAPVTATAAVPPSVPPEAILSSPFDGTTVTAPTPVTGVAYSMGLASWKLESRLRPAVDSALDTWKTLASGVANLGTPATGSDPAVPGKLGTFDPTNLLNGIYELRLRAADISGRTVITAPISVVVEGRLKLGVLSESRIEVSLPTPGFPLEVIRHYDSRDPRIGDFGVGGTLANTDYRLQKSLALGEAWFAWSDTSGPAGFPAYMLDPAPPLEATGVPPAPRTITITLPTDVVYRFSARMDPRRQVGGPIRFGRMVFDPMPGTVGTLVPLDDARQVDDEVMVGGDDGMLGTVDLIGYDDWLYDPKLFRLTLPDGTVYIIDEVLGLLEMTDANGNRIEYREDRIVHSSGLELRLVRDAAGCITQVLDPAGNSVDYTYDADHRLISVSDREGRTTSFGYSGSSGLVTSITPPAAIQPTFNVWDGFERFAARVDGMLKRMELGYDSAGYSETKKDPLGHVTTYQMDDYGRMLKVTDPLGGTTSYTYGDSRNPFLHTTVTDPLGRVTRYAYNVQGLPTAITDPLGNVTRYEYSSLGKVTKDTDPLGNSVLTTYDASGNTLSVTDRDGAIHSYSYDADGNVLAAIDPLGEVTTFTYNAQALPLTEETRASDGTLVSLRKYSYDIYGNRNADTITVTNSDGSTTDVTTRSTFDLTGNLLVKTFPDGSTETNTYDAAGRLASTTDRLGHTVVFTYDAAGRRIRSTFDDGTGEVVVYDAKGRPVSVTDRRGGVTVTEYDPLDHVTKTVLADGSSTSAVFDLAGQLVSETDPAGTTTTVAYDGAGRPDTITHADGTTTSVTYDAGGNALEVTPRVFSQDIAPVQGSVSAQIAIAESGGKAMRASSAPKVASFAAAAPPAGPRYSFSFDAAHRITEIRNPDGTTSSIMYDMVGRPVSTTNELGVTWSYEYSDSRAVSRSRVAGPLGYSERYSVNALACVTSRRDALGRETIAAYPADKYQPDSITYPDGTTETFTYDSNGRTTRLVDRRGNTTDFSYVEGSDGGYTRTTSRSVTVVDAGTPATSTATYTTTETFDVSGNQVESIESDGLGTARTTVHTYDYFNRRTSTTMPDGTVLKTVYGPGGRIDSVTETTSGGDRITAYTYDANGHLTELAHPDGTKTVYQYAADGRFLSQKDPRGGETTYRYNDASHIVYVTDPLGATTTRTYDALGHLLSEVDALGHATTYKYDDLGRRSSVTDALGQTTTFTYDLAGNVVSVTDPLGRVATYARSLENDWPTGFTLTGSASAPGAATIGYQYDEIGNRITLTDPLGRETKFVYDQLSRQIATTLPTGLARSTRFDIAGNELARHEYDRSDHSSARTVAQTFDAGNRLLSRTLPEIVTTFGERPVKPVETFTYDSFGRLKSHQDARLATTGYEYDGVTDRVKTVVLPGGGSRMFTYDEMGNPTTTTDARGILTNQRFDAGQRLVSRSVAGSRTTSFGYDLLGNLISVSYPSGQTITSSYDALRRVVRQNALLDSAKRQYYSREFEYDAGSRLTAVTDGNGVTSRTYDFQDRELTVDEPLGRSLTRRYDVAGDLLSVTDARGGETTYAYDSVGQPASVTDAEGGVRSVAFDVFDQLVSEELGSSRTTYEYDNYGRVVKATRHGGGGGNSVTETLWGPTGLPMASRDPLGAVTTSTYTPRGWLSETTHPDGESESFDYDAEGRVVGATDGNGNTRTFTHNLFGEIESVTDATGSATSYTYDSGGLVSSIKDPTGRTTSYTYDEAGRLTSTTLPDGSTVTTRTYDEFGNLTALTDPDGRSALYEYDALNRLVKARVPVSAATSAESRYGYDTANNLASILDPLGRLSSFTHDKVDRLTAVHLPGSGATPHEAYEYDARGLPTKRTDAGGYSTTMEYDALGRLTRTAPDARRGEPAVGYAYDARGLRTRMTDGLGTTTYSHDARGRLTSKTTPFAGTLSYGYDAAGNVTSLTSSVGGLALGYTYDAENRLARVDSSGGASAAPVSTSYARDAAGRLTATALPNGVTESRTYDSNGLLSGVSNSRGADALTGFALTRGATGRVDRVDESIAGQGTRRVEFTYDHAGRLLSETAFLDGPTGSLAYTLDLAGNRLARTGSLGGLGTQSFTVDEDNALTDGTYDDNGNLSRTFPSEPDAGFGYDFRDALRSRSPAATASADRVEFLHDGDGRRVGRRELDPLTGRWRTIHYLVAEQNPTGYDQVFAEVGEGSLVRSFAYGEQRLAVDGFVETDVRGGRHSLALDASGQVWAWGDNSEGQLGLGNTDGSSNVPVPVPGLDHVAGLAAGRFHSVALRDDGTVWVWGGSTRGQLGLGDGVSATVPTQVPGLADVVAIATYLDHTLALTLDGEVWAWGANEYGQLGDGTTIDRAVPVHLTGLVADEIAVGQVHSLARSTDGHVWVWGDNSHGQLADGSIGGSSSTPVEIAGLAGVDRLVAGGFHTLIRETDGSVWAWGGNSYGQLGDGSQQDRAAPVAVVPAANAVSLAAGSRHSLALLGDGSVLAWGDNREGQLGLGSVANSLVPTSLVGLGGVTEIAAGGRRSLARTASGLQGWGDGEFTPQSVAGDLSLATLGGESGVDSRSYGLGIARAFYAYDPQGNVRALTDGTGALAASYTYDAYGNLLSPSSTSTLNFNPYLFQGERFEAAAGLYHLRARDYDPRLGRFQQLDSFEGVPGQPFSHNRYTYSEADPVNLHDPSGHYAVTVWQAVALLDQQVAYNDFLASIGPKEQLLDIGAYSGNYAYAMGPRPQVVQRERPIWLMASGSGSILGSLEDESGAKTENNFTRGLGVGSNVFFLAQTGSPVRASVVERLVDSAWLATQRAWPNLNTGPKLPSDVRAQYSLKWQNRWPDVVYHNALLQGALRSALLGREVEAFAAVTFRPPTILPQTRSATALRALNGVSGGGPLDWRASAASAEGAFLSKVSASGWEYGQMEMMQEWSAAALGSDAYRFASIWAGVGVRLPGELGLMGASLLPGVGEYMDVHSSVYGETALERNIARFSLGLSVVTGGLSPNFGRIGRAIGEIGGEVARLGRRGAELASHGTVSAMRAAEHASLAIAKSGSRALGNMASGVRTAGNYAAAFEKGYLRGAAKYAGQLNCGIDPTPFFHGVLEGAREARALHNAPRITAEVADTAADLARTERRTAAALTDAAESAASLRTQIAGKGHGGHHLVDRVAGEIEGAVRQADRVLQVGGTGGTRWGVIYQRYAGTGHWLEPVARGNALQSIVNARLANNTYVREAGVLFNQGSLRGLRSASGALLRPDFQIPLSNGKLGIIDLTTPGQAPKISKYADPQTPFLLNVLYGQ